jgi:hypothetical protein
MESAAESLAIARLMSRLFLGRKDRILIDDGFGHVSIRNVDKPLTAKEIAEEHLTHAVGYGVLPLLLDGTIHFAAIDFDHKPHNPRPEYREDAAYIAAELESVGLKPLVEISQSGSGVHVWVFFEQPTAAAIVRRLLDGVLLQLGLIATEVFPKQDELTSETPIGNAIRLPLYNKSRFVDPSAGWKTLPPLETLHSVHRISEEELQAAAQHLAINLDPANESQYETPANRAAVSISPEGLTRYVRQLLAREGITLARRWEGETDGLRDPSRSGLAMAICCCLVWAFVPTEDIIAALRHWCEENHYEKGQRDEWIFLTVEKAYEYVHNNNLHRKQKQQLEKERKEEKYKDQSPAIRREYAKANRKLSKRR